MIPSNDRAQAESLGLGSSDDSGDFVIKTRMYAGDSDQPVAQHRIVFVGDRAYDFTVQPADLARFVTLFDFARGEIVLLDRRTQLRSHEQAKRLADLTVSARAAANTPQQRAALGLDAAVVVGGSGQQYGIEFGNLRYSTTTSAAPNAVIARRFSHFCDLAARLNIARRIPAPPPFARLKLNQRMAADARLPTLLEFTAGSAEDATHLRVGHDLEQVPTAADHKATDEVDGMIKLYKQVPLAAFPAK